MQTQTKTAAKASAGASSAIDQMVAATPTSRDRYVDFLRGLSILTVVFGHWLIGVNHIDQGVVYTTSAIGTVPNMWVLTWFMMVMPIFFFVGGFANFTGFASFTRRGKSAGAFRRSRMVRLLKPSAVFLGIWTTIQVALHLANIGGTAGFLRGVQPPGSTVPFGPLWFLPVYIAVVLTAPWTIKLHHRFGAAVPAVMLAVICLVDTIAFGFDMPALRWVNGMTVWLLPHQIGYFYADGTLQRAGRRGAALLAAAGLAGLVVLTSVGSYPKSMLGTGLDTISNVNPPTICIATVGFWLIGLALLVHEQMTRFLQRPRVWKGTIAVNGSMMSLYLWHMTAYLVAMVALMPLGIGTQATTNVSWWIQRPIWIGVPALILVAFVAIFRRFETPSVPRSPRRIAS